VGVSVRLPVDRQEVIHRRQDQRRSLLAEQGVDAPVDLPEVAQQVVLLVVDPGLRSSRAWVARRPLATRG
jgi:hypothetical protein